MKVVSSIRFIQFHLQTALLHSLQRTYLAKSSLLRSLIIKQPSCITKSPQSSASPPSLLQPLRKRNDGVLVVMDGATAVKATKVDGASRVPALHQLLLPPTRPRPGVQAPTRQLLRLGVIPPPPALRHIPPPGATHPPPALHQAHLTFTAAGHLHQATRQLRHLTAVGLQATRQLRRPTVVGRRALHQAHPTAMAVGRPLLAPTQLRHLDMVVGLHHPATRQPRPPDGAHHTPVLHQARPMLMAVGHHPRAPRQHRLPAMVDGPPPALHQLALRGALAQRPPPAHHGECHKPLRPTVERSCQVRTSLGTTSPLPAIIYATNGYAFFWDRIFVLLPRSNVTITLPGQWCLGKVTKRCFNLMGIYVETAMHVRTK